MLLLQAIYRDLGLVFGRRQLRALFFQLSVPPDGTRCIRPAALRRKQPEQPQPTLHSSSRSNVRIAHYCGGKSSCRSKNENRCGSHSQGPLAWECHLPLLAACGSSLVTVCCELPTMSLW